MPIYEYQCQACQHELEALQKISDEPLVECPECGKPALKKKVSAAAFRRKGGNGVFLPMRHSPQAIGNHSAVEVRLKSLVSVLHVRVRVPVPECVFLII